MNRRYTLQVPVKRCTKALTAMANSSWSYHPSSHFISYRIESHSLPPLERMRDPLVVVLVFKPVRLLKKRVRFRILQGTVGTDIYWTHEDFVANPTYSLV